MQWSADKNAGFSAADQTYLPIIDDETYGYKVVNVAAQEDEPQSYLWATRFLLQARQQEAALQRGEMETLDLDNRAVLAYWRVYQDSRLLCLFNLSAEQQSVALDLASFQGHLLTDLLTERGQLIVSELPAVINLRPYGSYWLRPEEK